MAATVEWVWMLGKGRRGPASSPPVGGESTPRERIRD